MTKLEYTGVALEKILPTLFGGLLAFAGSGYFAEKAAPLETRIRLVEIASATTSIQYADIIRRLERFEEKFDQRRK